MPSVSTRTILLWSRSGNNVSFRYQLHTPFKCLWEGLSEYLLSDYIGECRVWQINISQPSAYVQWMDRLGLCETCSGEGHITGPSKIHGHVTQISMIHMAISQRNIWYMAISQYIINDTHGHITEKYRIHGHITGTSMIYMAISHTKVSIIYNYITDEYR